MAKAPEALQIGNTTFRRPWRIPEGLRVLKKFNSSYDFKKNRKSEEYEAALIKSISATGVLESQGKDKSWKGGHGRKFLNFCQKFGFVTPRPNVVRGKGIYDLNSNGEDEFIIDFLKKTDSSLSIEKLPFSLTPLGNLLADTESEEFEITSEQKDIFLKSLYYQLQPSVLHSLGNNYEGETIRPLQLFLRIFFKLAKKDMEQTLSYGEIALVINPSWTNNLDKIINELKEFRDKKKGKERKFSKEWFENKGGKEVFKVDFDSIWTYADPNISYLVSTGLVDKIGKKIILNSGKKEISKIISKENEMKFKNDYDYLEKFWSGGLLPFEDEKYLINKANLNNNILETKFNYKDDSVSEKQNIKKIIYKTEDKIKEFEEIEFFKSQKNSSKEIVSTLENINKDIIKYNGIEFEPEPEHLEWIVWRAFLAINSFINEIKNTRGFPVDNRFLPTHHAPGGKEDLFFEFDDYCLIVEVTFKTKGSQFKDEVEPVYRHTAKKMKIFKNKKVYCLFIAPEIDLNLSSSFQRTYYDSQNQEHTGNIVPITIEQFTKIFLELFHKKGILTPLIFKEIFDKILEIKEDTNPMEWQLHIDKTIEENIIR